MLSEFMCIKIDYSRASGAYANIEEEEKRRKKFLSGEKLKKKLFL